MHSDHQDYFKFSKRSRMERSINSLLGIIEGISIDSKINKTESGYLEDWLAEHQSVRHMHPFNDVIPVLLESMADGIITSDEKDGIAYLCKNLQTAGYHEEITSDMHRLHAILGAISCDKVISEAELRGLSDWLADHEQLKTCWPYEEVVSLVTGVLADKIIDEREHSQLLEFFADFGSPLDACGDNGSGSRTGKSVLGLCAVCPEIIFQEKHFCFTGASSRLNRKGFMSLVSSFGGYPINNVTRKLDYLIIGSEGNPCWAYTCYGRKVEQAIGLRKSGSRLILVHENDFHDAISDFR